jgi:ABC-type lipoprotein export system ATPase subunit
MVITGPNGCGKSTLLNALRGVGEGAGRTLYVGPHRNSRRQNVRMRYLGQQRIEMSNLLAGKQLPGLEGISLPSHERDAWNFDEAQSFLKYSLCQVELERQNAITTRFDNHGSVDRCEIPDIWTPLRELAENLLPHLRFRKIDLANRDQVRCLWNVHDLEVLVDLDDLSSGEKAVIQLFFPLIEHRLNEALARMKGEEESPTSEQLAVLMDEPELHLHPNLQVKVLDYMRGLAFREGIQFILVTHSPSMVEHATSEELYLLRPAELLGSDENQLIKLADSEERLNSIRALFGSTSNVTALRTLLVVEGKSADAVGRRPADARIYGFLSDRFGQITVISGGGKSECRALAKALTECLPHFSGKVRACALLDRDTLEVEPTHPGEYWLPVSTIENLLLDPEVIYRALETVRHRTELQDVAGVATEINAILDSLNDHEIARRVKASVEARTFRLKDPIQQAREQVEEFATRLLSELSADEIDRRRESAASQVAALTERTRRREMFDGKRVLEEFYKRHVHRTGLSREVFVYLCAKEAASRTSVSKFVQSLFDVLELKH